MVELLAELVPFLLSNESTAAMSAPATVNVKLVSERISTLPVVLSVRVVPPSPVMVSALMVMSLVAPMVLTRLVPVTVKTWVVPS